MLPPAALAQEAVSGRFSELTVGDWFTAIAAAGVGVVLLLFGHRLYRITLVLGGAVAGGSGAIWLSQKTGASASIAMPGAVGAALGAIGAHLAKDAARAILGGGAGAVALIMLAPAVGIDPDRTGVLAAIGLVGFVAIAWFTVQFRSDEVRRAVIVFATSCWGALLLVGVSAVMFGITPTFTDAPDGPGARLLGMHWVWFALTALGAGSQYAGRYLASRTSRERK